MARKKKIEPQNKIEFDTKFKIGDKAWQKSKDKFCIIKDIVPQRDCEHGYKYDIWRFDFANRKYAHYCEVDDLRELTKDEAEYWADFKMTNK